MGWLVVVLGSALSALGATVIKLGLDIAVRDERGWTQVISGSVGFSAGIITFALGLVLMRLGGLRRDLGRMLKEQRPDVRRAGRAEAAEGSAPSEAGRHAAAFSAYAHQSAAPERPAAPVAASGAAVDHPAAGPPGGSGSKPAAAAPSSGGWEPEIGGARDEPEAAPRAHAAPHPRLHDGAAPAPSTAPPSGAATGRGGDRVDADWREAYGAGTIEAPHAQAESRTDGPAELRLPGALEPAAAAATDNAVRASVVVGQYEANGVSYIMYADGSIDADTPEGIYRFENIAELKRFIESHVPAR